MKNNLSPDSKVWVYQSSRPFTESEAKTILEKINKFVHQWTAHKMQVSGDGALLYNRFVILMVDETQVGVSGCSVDSSVNFIRSLGQEFGVNFFDRWLVSYIKDGEVLSSSLADFEKLIQNSELSDETIVFNNLVKTKSEMETKWQLPYKNSWLKKVSATHTSFSSVL